MRHKLLSDLLDSDLLDDVIGATLCQCCYFAPMVIAGYLCVDQFWFLQPHLTLSQVILSQGCST